MRWLQLKPRLAYGILFAVLASGLLFASYKLPFDPDLFWHIRAGQDIARIGIPFVDWYSHTLPTFFWINHEYLQDLFMGWVHGLVGFRGLSIVYAAITAFGLGVGVWWSMARRLGWLWSLGAGITIALASRSFIGARPQMVTYGLLLALVGVLRRALRTGRLRWFILIPIIFAVWSNVHASFVAGFIVLLIFIVTESAKIAFKPYLKLGPVAGLRQLGWLAIAGLVSVPATFANPYGWNIWLEPYRSLTDKALHNNIVEWFGPQTYTMTGWILFGGVAILAALFLVRQARTNMTDGALALAFFVASLLAVRNIPLFLIFAVPLAFEIIRSFKPSGAEIAVRLWPTLLAALLFVAAGASRFPLETFRTLDHDQTVFTQSDYPVGAAQFLAEHNEYAESHPFNEYGWGGYLLYKVPWFKTFIDGRMPSWQTQDFKIIDEYFAIERRTALQETLDRFSVDLFVIKPDSDLIGELTRDHGFNEVFKDEQAIILAK
ncbi:MAG: hypothetical protein Q8P33_00120 [bacterium]|nr:hypothetical protein [bacterium]